MAAPLKIEESSISAWQVYRDAFDFVPDPMILRAGEVFLNGLSSAQALDRKDFDLLRALEENVAGIVDFFDMVVTRETIPLINYEDTFDSSGLASPLTELLGDRVSEIRVGYNAYQVAKRGALDNLATIDLARLGQGVEAISEMHAFGYDWRPKLELYPEEAEKSGDPARIALTSLPERETTLAQFLLGGLIFASFAQASNTVHHIQPKRSRFLLGLTAAPEVMGRLRQNDEEAIFTKARKDLIGSDAVVCVAEPLPPVLPYLIATSKNVKTPRDLLNAALDFRESRVGGRLRQLAKKLRGDGTEARLAVSLLKETLTEARALLDPYSHLDEKGSQSLEIELSAKASVGFLELKGTKKVRSPAWLKIWWNKHVPFGGLRKNLRRMWMQAESYDNFWRKLRDVWTTT
jgi:hypothetical protein